MTRMNKIVTLYTDGACSGNPGPGGWACVLVYKGQEKELSGGAKETTNNRMEMTAVIEGLKALKEPCVIDHYTDSKYVLEGATKWLSGWREKGWKKADKKSVLNVDLWQVLADLFVQHEIRWHWVKGHAGDVYNERVDMLAVAQRDAYK